MTKKEKGGGGEGAPAWLLTYGDMVTLLMAFFVMLFAISSVEQEKFEAFVSGLGQFGNPGAGQDLSPIGEPISPPVRDTSPIAEGIPMGSGTDGADGGLQDVSQQVAAAVAEAGFPDAVEVTFDERGIAISLTTDAVLFATGRTEVTEAGRAIIGAIAGELRGLPNELLVEGHTDNVPLDRGGYSNWNLSTDRAVAVVNLLIDEHGINPSRLTASGYGEYDPLMPGDTAEARQRNRRVEIVIVRTAEEASAVGTGDVAEAGATSGAGVGIPPPITAIAPPIGPG